MKNDQERVKADFEDLKRMGEEANEAWRLLQRGDIEAGRDRLRVVCAREDERRAAEGCRLRFS